MSACVLNIDMVPARKRTAIPLWDGANAIGVDRGARQATPEHGIESLRASTVATSRGTWKGRKDWLTVFV